MENFSTTQASNITILAGFLVMVARHYRWDIAQEEIVALLGGLAVAVGVIVSFVSRYRKGDLTIIGARK